MQVPEEAVLEGIFGENLVAYHRNFAADSNKLSPNQHMFRQQMCLGSCKMLLRHLKLLHHSCEVNQREQARAMTKFLKWDMAERWTH
jgi:hypothetical protein